MSGMNMKTFFIEGCTDRNRRKKFINTNDTYSFDLKKHGEDAQSVIAQQGFVKRRVLRRVPVNKMQLNHAHESIQSLWWIVLESASQNISIVSSFYFKVVLHKYFIFKDSLHGFFSFSKVFPVFFTKKLSQLRRPRQPRPSITNVHLNYFNRSSAFIYSAISI